jgi:uncharacterized protein (DUF1330 family)
VAASFIVPAAVRDPVAHQNYTRRSPDVLAMFGGRGGRVITFEGPAEDWRIVVAEFPDFATAETCYRSAEYQAIITTRKHCATFEFIPVDGVADSSPQGERS